MFYANRRSMLASAVGGAISVAMARRLAAVDQPTGSVKSCILLWMNGGPSHIDTVDPKPGTATGGTFKTIATKAAGVQFCEHLPRLANEADKLVVIRSMTSKEGNHDRGQYLLHTGYPPSVTVKHPSLGAWVAHELGKPDAELPNFVSIRGPSISSGFLGAAYNPFVVQHPGEGVRNLPFPKDVNVDRFQQRLRGLDIVEDAFAKATGAQANAAARTVRANAVRLMGSRHVKAFEIESESATVRKLYGDSEFGKGCLMARRLVEVGVPFVEVTLDGWDTHVDNFNGVKNLCGELDPGFAGLLRDLADRKLLDETLVVWMGEFGRTPKISAANGRDHHPAAWSAMLAGAKVAAGKAYGETDAEGGKVAKNPVTVADLFATIATLMGIDPSKSLMSPIGRPISMSENGTVRKELIKG